MAKRDIEAELIVLSNLRNRPCDDEAVSALRKALKDRIHLIPAKAADVAGALKASALIPDLLAAFPRYFSDPSKTDPQCAAKNAIVKALTALQHDLSTPFVRGLRHVQMEPVWGGQEDTAGVLRGLCLMALLPCGDLTRVDKLRHMVRAMNDAEEPVRIDAIRAIEEMAGDEAALVLRLKLGCGDAQARVVGQVVESMLRLEGARAIDPLNDYFAKPLEDEFLEEAALGAGASRVPDAVDFLIGRWNARPHPVFLQAISIVRLDPAIAFLHGLIRDGRERDATAAVDSLALHKDSAEIAESTLRAVQDRGSDAVDARFQLKFATRP